MRRCPFVVAILVSILFILVSINIAYAQWSAIKNSGYAVTTNWHGEEVPLGQTVTAWAGTTDPDITKVEFKWKAPNTTLIWDYNVTVFGPYTTSTVPSNVPQEIRAWAEDHTGYTIWYANNTQIPKILGDWGIQAIFHNSGGGVGHETTRVAIRATSTHVIPEAPLGTIAIVLTMLAAVSFIATRNRKIPFPF